MRARKTQVKKVVTKKARAKKVRMRKIVIWSLVNDREHELLTAKAMTTLVATLFPGIDYYSITGFSQVMRECLIPVLKKRFPELRSVPSEQITANDAVEITEFLPSRGYEWQVDNRWRSRFEKLLAAA